MILPYPFTQAAIRRFWIKVDIRDSDSCWLWQAFTDEDGYGRFTPYGGCSSCPAHRFAWIVTHSIVPSYAKKVCHSCDTPGCCNPRHLWLGSAKQNSEDMVAKGRQAKGDGQGLRLHPESVARGERHGSRTHPEAIPHGEGHKNSKLRELDVAFIRRVYQRGLLDGVQLAAKYGVHNTVIYDVIHRRRWKHV